LPGMAQTFGENFSLARDTGSGVAGALGYSAMMANPTLGMAEAAEGKSYQPADIRSGERDLSGMERFERGANSVAGTAMVTAVATAGINALTGGKVTGTAPKPTTTAEAPQNTVAQVKNWWKTGAENDTAWRALPLKDKVYYEVGQKTLPDGVWQKYGNLDPVARGRALVQDQGWLGAVKPQGAGWKLGAGETLHTGPTPLIRWAVPRAAGAGAVGGAAYYLYSSENE